MGKQSVYVHSNAEIENFIKENELIIYKGCSLAYWNNTTLRRADWDIVKDTVALKFANGTLNYNPSKNVKYSTFLCTVAKNCAIDEIRRQHPERVQDLDDKGWERVGDGYESHYATEEKDERILVKEGVRP